MRCLLVRPLAWATVVFLVAALATLLTSGCTTNRTMRRTFDRYYVHPPRRTVRDLREAQWRVHQQRMKNRVPVSSPPPK